MKRIHYFFLPMIVVGMMSCEQKQSARITPDPYPETRKDVQTDEYFGAVVEDPFRWLEDDNSQETGAWVEAQNNVTFGYLEQIPFRDKIRERLTHIWDYPRYGTPFREGENYFFFKNDGLQNQSVMYIRKGLEAEETVFLDPNTFSEDGTVALANISFSGNGKLLAYSISRSGSDWQEIHVMDVESGRLLEDHLKWVKFSGISWSGNGFYYSRYDEPGKGEALSGKNEFHKVFFHKVGDLQSADMLVYKNDQFPLRNYYAMTTEDESFVIVSESESTSGNALYVKKTNEKDFIRIAEGFDYEYDVIDNIGEKLLVMTNQGAPKWQLVLVDPAGKNWETVIPEKDEVLRSVSLAGGRIIAAYMKDASSRAYIFDMNGSYLEELALPGIGTLGGFRGKKEDNLAFFSYTSFTFPSTVFKYDISGNKADVYFNPEIDFDVNNYETSQVFYPGKDGTKVPMFIVHRKGLTLNGNNPCYLYGYGGFNISLTPTFSLARLVLLENGFVLAVANLRGGGEYGKEWHEAGTKMKKQNVFGDFIAAAEYLIAENYTNPEKIAIAGGSNGGLLVGACMIQRPDLFKVALPAVGVLDMLRYHKFTIGWAWASDYGTSEDSPEMFEYLLNYSPLHTLKEGVAYPATLITTADHDDRVVPAHSFKFAATLQEKHAGDNPVLIRIDVKAGHGGGKPTTKVIEEYADEWAFTMYNLGVNPAY